jgi:FixJ family two-component response regulator
VAVAGNPNPFDVRLAFVLDDEARIGAVLCRMFEALGIAARSFTAAGEFMAELTSQNPDLVLLDLALGQTDAIEIIHELEASAFKGRVLPISGRDVATLMEVERVGRAHGLVMLPPLPKPFQVDDIRDCLKPLPLPPLQPELPEDERATSRRQHVGRLGAKA